MVLAETRGLRGYDAVQLAASCVINEFCLSSGLPVVTFVCADYALMLLNTAAAQEGLLIENPTHSP
jgi:hypothetical protein